MKLKAKRNDLLSAIAVVEKAISTKADPAILSGMLLDATQGGLVLTANNLAIAIKGNAVAEVTEPGKVVVPSKFCEIIRNLDEDIEINVQEDRATILSGKSRFQLYCMNAEEFPVFNQQEDWETVTFKDGELKRVLAKVLFAVSQDAGRPMFCCVNMGMKDGKFFAVSTDTFRLTEFTISVENETEFQLLVPGNGLKEIYRTLADGENDVKFYFSSKDLLVMYKQFTFKLPLVEGKFPNTSGVFPVSPKTTITVNPGLLNQVVNRASLLATNERRMITVSINDVIKISSAGDAGQTNENIDAEITGEELEKIYLNAGYMQDGIKAMNGAEKLSISFNGENGPCVFNGENYRYLVLPIKTSK